MPEKKWAEFEAFVTAMMTEKKIPGTAIAISQYGKIIYQQGFGVCDLLTKEPVTPATIFGIASVSKSFTAMAIMKLAAEGKLSVNDPVIQYIPEFRLHGLTDMSSVKIHHLLSHTTGLPPMRRREELNQLQDHPAYLAAEPYELLGRPGQFFSYCNDTFLLLGLIIERLSGRLFRRYMIEFFLCPLQMHRSTFSLEEVAKFDNVSVPYVKNNETNTVKAVPWPQLGNYEVGGGVRSNVLDLLNYGQLFINEGKFQGRTIVNQDYLSKMWQPSHPKDRKTSYGYALQVTPDYAGVTLVEHGGGQPGVSSHFGFVPEKGLVVVVLTNLKDVPAYDIWLAAVNTALGLPLDQRSNVEPVYEASMQEIQRLVGTYQTAEGGKITIFLDQQTPKAAMDGQVSVLRQSEPHILAIDNQRFPLRFFFKEDQQESWAVFNGSRVFTKVNT